MHEILKNEIKPYRVFPLEPREHPVMEIDPDRLPPLSWNNLDRAIAGVGVIALSSGVLTAAMGSMNMIIWPPLDSSLLIIITGIGLLALNMLRKLDPENHLGRNILSRIRVRTSIIQEFKNNDGLKEILERFKLSDHKVNWQSLFTKEDTTLLLLNDLRTLSYEEFMRRHGGEVFQHLTSAGIARLGTMFIERSEMRITDITKEPYNTIRKELNISSLLIQKKIINEKLSLFEFENANFQSIFSEEFYEETRKILLQ